MDDTDPDKDARIPLGTDPSAPVAEDSHYRAGLSPMFVISTIGLAYAAVLSALHLVEYGYNKTFLSPFVWMILEATFCGLPLTTIIWSAVKIQRPKGVMLDNRKMLYVYLTEHYQPYLVFAATQFVIHAMGFVFIFFFRVDNSDNRAVGEFLCMSVDQTCITKATRAQDKWDTYNMLMVFFDLAVGIALYIPLLFRENFQLFTKDYRSTARIRPNESEQAIKERRQATAARHRDIRHMRETCARPSHDEADDSD
jgi:hypothetical protein